MGGLGRRFVAALIDAAPAALVGVAATLILSGQARSGTVFLVTGIMSTVLVGAYTLYQCWAYGVRGAGIGARLMGLRLVGIGDGSPIGWWRWFVRQLIFFALMASVLGGILLVVFLVVHERRQGWHDMAVRAIVVQPKPGEQRTAPPSTKAPAANAVGLPPHLASSFSPRVDMGSQGREGTVGRGPAPEWMPRLETQPLLSSGPGGRDPFARPEPTPPEARDPHPPATLPPARPINQGWIPLPTPSSIIEPPKPTPRVRPRDFAGDEEDLDGTRISAPATSSAARRGHEGWYVRLDDGREVELSVTVLLGRNPQKAADDDGVHLVPAGGDGRMISRTHVLIGTDARGVFVTDRGSTNGTALVTRGGGMEPCPAGVQLRVTEGTQVSYGNRWFTVLRRPEFT